jgi:AcrR family transcriptional regulator
MAKIKAIRNGTKKEAITKKAAILFRKKGFAASPMRELAESIGVEAPSLYNHIGSKGELLQIICFKVANEFNLYLAEIESKIDLSVVEKLEALIRFHIRMTIDSYDELYVSNHEWKQLAEPFLSNFLLQRKTYESRLMNIVAQGIKDNELRNIHPYTAVLTILSALRGLEGWQRHKKYVREEELANDMTAHLLKGLIR